MQQLDLYSQTKEDKSIEFLQKHEPPEGWFLGFSGGKDSIVLYDLAVKSGVKFESATGIDPPEVMRFIKDYYPDVIWKRPNYKGIRSFYGMIPVRGFPTKFVRWCCDELKKNPTKDVPLNHRLMGIRAEELSRRSKRGAINTYKKWVLYSPIFDWLEWEVWDYIDENGLPYCSLYDEGFNRIGCVVCPFLCNPNPRILNMHKERWPAQYKLFEKAMLRLWYKKEWWQQTTKRYALLPEEFIDNWYRGRTRGR